MSVFKKIQESLYQAYFDVDQVSLTKSLIPSYFIFAVMIIIQFVIFVYLNSAEIMFTSSIFAIIFAFSRP